jgi:hypothetical protein
VRAAVFGHLRASREQASRRDPGHGVRCLRDKCGRLDASGFLGYGGVIEQLCEAAPSAKPHLQRVHRFRARIVLRREVVAGGLAAKVKHQVSYFATAGPASAGVHQYPRPDRK